jgi:hypothetical protein
MARHGEVAGEKPPRYTSWMPSSSLLVIAVDGLRASALGCYGNTSYPTPAFDRLASEGVVYDRYLAESSELAEVMDALWTGRHACEHRRAATQLSLPEIVKAQGGRSWIVTDQASLAEHPAASAWDEIVLVGQGGATMADDPFETSMGHVLASALEIAEDLSSGEQPSVLWVQMRGMEAPWDAPPELALRLRDDEEDPTWEPSLEIPRFDSHGDDDHDRTFAASCRYAGQVMALDHCLGALLAELDSEPRWDVLALGLRGFALGEHGSVGYPVPYREQLHLPLCYRSADCKHRLTRVADLVQPSDLFPWLSQFPRLDASPRPQRTVAMAHVGCRFAVTVEKWTGVEQADSNDEVKLELYVEPDDRWQSNNVASRCEEEAEELARICQQAREGGELAPLTARF